MTDGFLNVNKPLGWTSHDVVQVARKALGTKKIGHLGTLDPLATGVLVLAVGNATKLIEYLVEHEKEYDAEIYLGKKTDTYDAEGEPVMVTDTPVTEEAIEEVVKEYIGEIDQMPPKFSAKKIQGEAAYKKARRGEEVKLKTKRVKIHDIQIQSYRWPILKIHVRCGTGTYIRSLANDIGEKLGCGAYLSGLARTSVKNLSMATAVGVDEISKDALLPTETLLPDFPKITLSELDFERIKNGQSLPRSENFQDKELVIGMMGNELVSIMVYNAALKTLRPKKLVGK